MIKAEDRNNGNPVKPVLKYPNRPHFTYLTCHKDLGIGAVDTTRCIKCNHENTFYNYLACTYRCLACGSIFTDK